MSKRRRNKNNNSEQGCEVIFIDSGARPEVRETDTSWVDVPDDRTEEEKEKDFRINIVKDSEDDYVDAPDETKPDFGVSYDDKMAQILEEVSECESDESSEQVIEDSNTDLINTFEDSSIPVVEKLKKVKEAFEPKSDKEPATLGGTIIIILLIVVALIMVVNLCSVMGRLPVRVEEKETNVEQNMVTNSESSVEVIDTSKVQGAVSVSDKSEDKKEDKKEEDLSKVPGTDSSVILDEAGNPIVNESDSNVAGESDASPGE